MVALQKDPAARPANMEQYADMLAGVLQTLPPDPTQPHGITPGPMPIVPGVATPPGPSAPLAVAPTAASTGALHYGVPAPTPAPYHPYPQPAPYPQAYAPHARRSKLPLIMIVGALVLGGGAAGVYFATHKDAPAHADDKPVDDKPVVDKPAEPDKPLDPAKDPWQTPGKDPWATEGALQRPPPAPTEPGNDDDDVGTAATAIPTGAHLNPPSGFEKVANKAGWQMYASKSSHVLMILGALYPGTNDPHELANKWIADNSDLNLKLANISPVMGHTMATFTGQFNGQYITQYAQIYITPHYRIAYILQAPVAQTTDWKQVSDLIIKGVTVP
jgi:hypothetical protein